MYCPLCSAATSVVDSRLSQEGVAVRRRRVCQTCAFRFSTLEEASILDLVVVKRDGSREPYQRQKLERGLDIALGKRSHTFQQVQQLIKSIEVAIQSLRTQEITSNKLGEIVMDNLKGFDKVGYIRFASVYRKFEDVQTFEQEIQELKKLSP